jgi:hypothetical protein
LQEGYPSGQRGQTVNLLAAPTEVRILPPPPLSFARSPIPKIRDFEASESALRSAGSKVFVPRIQGEAGHPGRQDSSAGTFSLPPGPKEDRKNAGGPAWYFLFTIDVMEFHL